MNRSTFNVIFGGLSAALGLISLYLAVEMSGPILGIPREKWGKLMIGSWVLLPPIFFWVDWVMFCSSLSKEDKDAARHTHDLSRNIWLALVGVLTVLLGFKIKSDWL